MIHADARRTALERWLAVHLPAHGGGARFSLAPASEDASFRRYWRVRLEDGRTSVAMDAPPDKEDCRPFVRVARMLREAGLNAPEVLAQDLSQGFLLLSDLGTRTYLWRKSKGKGSKHVGGGELVSIAIQTGLVDVLASGEFCNARRRVAHLLTMYGFVIYVITTAVMVFGYPTPATPTPAIVPQLWWIGGLMVCLGGYWFWFFIRADVAAEGNSPFRVMRADLFILSLLASVTLGLIWAFLQAQGSAAAGVFFGLYIIAATVLFGSVPWSKFAHMFFKPAAAFEKRVSYANETRSNLPAPADKPEQFGSARELPRHY